jgi:hypothetical protein
VVAKFLSLKELILTIDGQNSSFGIYAEALEPTDEQEDSHDEDTRSLVSAQIPAFMAEILSTNSNLYIPSISVTVLSNGNNNTTPERRWSYSEFLLSIIPSFRCLGSTLLTSSARIL